MKKILCSVFASAIITLSFAQNTAHLTNVKDAWTSAYTYNGEVKNNVPNGLGIALYSEDNTAKYYVGYFVSGKFEGKGTLLFKDGTFQTGEWKAGKLNGKGTTFSTSGDLYIGELKDGVKNGAGTFFYNNNTFLIGNLLNGVYDGRCIYLTSDGKTLTDNYYKDDKKNGPGFQYSVTDKKLWEGRWSNGDWVQAEAAGYKSFLQNPNMYSEETETQLLMAPIDRNNGNKLKDTGYYYNIKDKKKYFGYYENGNLKSGLIIREDSTRFLGSLNNAGATGVGTFMKLGQYFDQGNYVDDRLSGPNVLSISLNNKNVYCGAMNNGAFTGKAYFASTSGTLYNGDYLKGEFTGNGWAMYRNGTFVKGTFNDGSIVKAEIIRDSVGRTINLTPKTFTDAFTELYAQYPTTYDYVYGEKVDLTNSELADPNKVLTAEKGLINLPGSIKNFTAFDGVYMAYISAFLKTGDRNKAIAKYNELCKAAQAARVITEKGKAPSVLNGTIEKLNDDAEYVYSSFTISGKDYDEFTINVVLQIVSDNDYRVYIVGGADSFVKYWLSGDEDF